MSEIKLLTPRNDEERPELSIVIPALNEEANIAEFIEWCKKGVASAGVRAEILIVDSSTDSTPDLALAGGARVLSVPRRGLGRAYIDAIPYIRGEWVLMGDADCTYDFRLLSDFVTQFRSGSEFVMGSRWLGSIEVGSMPRLHQYFGTPVTTWILNRIFGSRFSDIHCGMRGITRSALVSMNLESQSWEYASEMVLKSVHMELVTKEVPVRFLKDRNGRVSHHRREGWWSPFHAAFINLRAMFVYGARFFVNVPGKLLTLLGVGGTAFLSFGDKSFLSFNLSLLAHMFFVTMLILGVCFMGLSLLSKAMFDFSGATVNRICDRLTVGRSVLGGTLLGVIGLCLVIPFAWRVLANTPGSSPGNVMTHLAITGFGIFSAGFLTVVFGLLLHGCKASRNFVKRESTGV